MATVHGISEPASLVTGLLGSLTTGEQIQGSGDNGLPWSEC